MLGARRLGRLARCAVAIGDDLLDTTDHLASQMTFKLCQTHELSLGNWLYSLMASLSVSIAQKASLFQE